MLAEASAALASLDADRLEELALSCQALNRDLFPVTEQQREEAVRQSREAAGEMAVLARVLESTRANLDVMNRLRELKERRQEYSGAFRFRPAAPAQCAETGDGHGND
jgi:hypothetical protein